VAPNFFAMSSFDCMVIDGEDALRAGDRRALDGVQADPAAAEHGDAGTRLDARSVEHRADPVVTAQPTSAARSSGIFGSIFTTLSTDSVAYSPSRRSRKRC
jgi:hypothetical protein